MRQSIPQGVASEHGQYGIYCKDDWRASNCGQFRVWGGIWMEHGTADFRPNARLGTNSINGFSRNHPLTGTGGIGMATATCDFRFSLQNEYADDDRLLAALKELKISNQVVTVSGRATRSEKEISRQEFVDADAGSIQRRLTNFLEEHDLPRPDDLVILDMEPRGFSPRALGTFYGREQRELIDAYRLRIRVARQVLRRMKLSGVKLALYQVIVPEGKGRRTEEFEERIEGYEEAGRQGMYDQLDYICPVLYQRFGEDDATPERVAEWTGAATRQAIEESLRLTRTNGKHIPLAPILSFWVFNGNSKNNRKAASRERVANQLDIVQGFEGVEIIVFWSGSETEDEMKSQPKPVQAIDISNFLREMGSLPWPGCA